MRISSISDVHVIEATDDRGLFLLSFLRNKKVLESDIIILLGDVFDFLVGDRNEYLPRYEVIFSEIEQILLNTNVKVFFVEGNHDFHVGNILKNRFFGLDNFFYYNRGVTLKINGKKRHYCHGDEIEIGNPKYQIFRKLVRGSFFRLLATNFFSMSFVEKSRQKVAGNSRKYFGEYSEDVESFLREKFRGSAIYHAEKHKLDSVVCGHSHIEDHISGNGFDYINNGFSTLSRKFVYFDGVNFSLERV